MSNIVTRAADLSAEEKRALLGQLLEENDIELNSFPLSFAQERLWFLNRWEPDSPAYNVSRAIQFRGTLNVKALRSTLEAIVSRHESLRTTFSLSDREPVQIISGSGSVSMPLIDLSGQSVSEESQAAEVRRLSTEEARRVFDLNQGPLLRATLLRLSEEEHVLLLIMHHIISDGWSMGVLLRELSVLYEAHTTGKPSPLPELPIQYADFAVWQREWLQGEVLEAQLAYWKRQLGESLPVLQLPTDHPRPATQTFRGARQSLMLPQHVSEGLEALSRQEGVTLFMALLAAFKTLLYRYTGQEDIAVGSPLASRNRSEIEGLIGFFVNTLVLRSDLSGTPTFRELLERTRKVALDAYAHQDMPFEKLVEEIQPERDLSHNPLFQVMFILQNTPGRTLELPGLAVSDLEVDNGTAKFDLTLSIVEGVEGLKATFEYNTDLFDEATVTRMAGHFRVLLEGIVADPDRRLSGLPLLTEVERHQLLVGWNETQADYPEDKCIHELFEAQVEQTPEAIAVVFDEEQLTYQELNRRANQLAHHLRRLGVGPGVLVGICLERSLEMVIGLLGILKAGGAYVPLDPAYPKERLAFMLEDSEVSILLTQERLVGHSPLKVVCLDTDWESISQESQEDPITKTTADDVAYVIYTSGSTGKPKGVLGLNRGAVNRFMWMWESYPFEAGEICCQKTPLSFVDSVWEIFGPLLQGIPTIIISDETLKDPRQLVEILAAHRVTRIVLVPSLLRVLLDIYDDLQRLLPHLRIWVTSGEALSPTLLQRFRKSIPQGMLLNLLSADSTWYDTSKDKSLPLVPIGRPISNTQVYILDAHLQPVPIGVSGELHIGGVGLARGYLNRPELTAERFIRSPFSNELGERLYKTGDLVRYRPDGSIEFLGRKDHQVKIRGFRIELGEIEATLSQHPGVRQNVIIAREDTPNEKRLVAYLVPKGETAPSVSELHHFLREKLPEHMVPTAFVTLEALPLTPNGKVNRRALPAPDTARPELEKAFVIPRDTLEVQLVKIWEEILGVQVIGVRDNFFDLGGHSLLGVRLFARIKEEFGQELPLATLFQAPTVEQLADVLRRSQAGWTPPWTSLVPMQPGGSNPPFFCVPGNLGNVFVDLGGFAQHLGPDQPFYGLQDGIQNPARIGALAARYVDEIQAVQPEGPYFLGGVCSGGVVAFEMAQQLLVQGQKVALLALVEPSPPSAPSLRTYFRLGTNILRRVLQRAGHHSRSFAQPTSGQWRTYAHQKAKLVANMWAVASYAPQTYAGWIDLFLGNESLSNSSTNSQLGWRNLAAGGLEIHAVPGNHATITRTYDAIPDESQVRLLAEALKACIDGVMTDDVHRQDMID
jgi:aspartate racemase